MFGVVEGLLKHKSAFDATKTMTTENVLRELTHKDLSRFTLRDEWILWRPRIPVYRKRRCHVGSFGVVIANKIRFGSSNLSTITAMVFGNALRDGHSKLVVRLTQILHKDVYLVPLFQNTRQNVFSLCQDDRPYHASRSVQSWSGEQCAASIGSTSYHQIVKTLNHLTTGSKALWKAHTVKAILSAVCTYKKRT